MNMKFKTVEEGIDYALENDIPSFEVGGKVYFVDDVDDISEYDDIPLYENGVYVNGGQPKLEGLNRYQNGSVPTRPQSIPSEDNYMKLFEAERKASDYFEVESEARQQKLRDRVQQMGFGSNEADAILEAIFANGAVTNEDGSISGNILLNNKAIGELKDSTGILITELGEEINNILDLEKSFNNFMQNTKEARSYLEQGQYIEQPTQEVNNTNKRQYKFFKNGGEMNQQIMGYKDNSPYKDLPFQDFNTNTLTMQGVSRPILALPNVGQPQIMLPNSGIYSFPMANQIREIPIAKNGFFSRLGKGIGNAVRGVGNVAHDWGVGIADSFGNNTGMFDIDNSRYKTGLGRSVSGFNDQWQSGVGQVGRSIASTMVPGISNLTGMMGGNQQQMPQQQVQQYPQQQQQPGGFDQMQMLMSFLPYLQRGAQGQPLFLNGGKTNLTGRFNPYSQMSAGSFKQGGMTTAKSSLITDSDSHNKKKGSGASYSKNGPMGPRGYNYSTGRRDVQDYSVFNEYIATENLIPIQTEKDELIVLPTGDITPVMASKRHSRMGEDEVTDVTPEGSYILSAHGDVKIYKDEAQGLITEMGVKPYRLGYAQEKPTERTLADLMSDKKMSPAQLGARVMKQFPIWKTNNIFEASANQENKLNRKPYLEGIIQLSELDRYRKGLVQPEQMRNGGSVMRRDFIPKAQTGMEVMLIGQALQAIMGGIGAQEQANRRNRDLLYTENNIINPAYNDASRLSWTGSGLNTAALMAQDTNVDSAQYDPSFIRQAQLTTPDPIRQALSNRAYANRPNYMQFAPSFSAGVSAEQAGYASALKQAYDTEIGIFNSDRSQKNKMLEVLQGYQDKNLDSRVAELNAEGLNNNQRWSGLGAIGQGAFDTQSDLRLKRGQTLAQLRMQQSLNDSQAIASRYNTANNLIGTGTLAYQNYLQNRPPVTIPSIENRTFNLTTPTVPNPYQSTGYNFNDSSTWGGVTRRPFRLDDVSTWR